MNHSERDAQLLERIRKKDSEALETVVRLYTGYVLTVIRKISIPPLTEEDAEELAADTFMTLWKKAEQLREPSALKAYIAQIAHNAAIDRARRHKITVPLDEQLIARDRSPETAASLHEQAQIITAALDAMESVRRACLFYRYYYGEELAQIAKRLNLPLSTVKSHIYRGRRQLIRTLHEWGYSYDENN